jgi:hypothetical protein
MILYIQHTRIDRERWDDCIRRSVNSLVYAFSWYLDIVSPGWEALVEDDYSSVFPLTHHSKAGIRYLRQPFFCQQLGIFSTNVVTEDMVTRFLLSIPSQFRFAEIHLNYLNKVDGSLFSCTHRMNHELELIQSYPQAGAGYDQNVRRNIRKAREEGIEVHRKIEPDVLIRLFRDNFGKREGKLGYRNYLTIQDLITHALRNSAGIIMGAGKAGAEPDAAAFFLRDRDRFIFLFSATDFRTRENGSMFLLLDTFIREHSSRPMLLDFEGGNDPGLGRFYKSFGARESRYPAVRINRLPPVLNFSVSLAKRLRRLLFS